MEVPKHGNSKGESAEIKAGEIPEGWAEGSSNRLAQKDLDARWTKKGGMSYYGYKNHVSTDRRYKLVRRWAVTDGTGRAATPTPGCAGSPTGEMARGSSLGGGLVHGRRPENYRKIMGYRDFWILKAHLDEFTHHPGSEKGGRVVA